MLCCVFNLFSYFWEDEKLGSVVGGEGVGWECGFLIICFKIGLLNFSLCLWSPFLLVFFFQVIELFVYMLFIRGKFTLTLLFWFPYSNQEKGVGRKKFVFFFFLNLFFLIVFFYLFFIIIILICFVFNPFCKCMC